MFLDVVSAHHNTLPAEVNAQLLISNLLSLHDPYAHWNTWLLQGRISLGTILLYTGEISFEI
jgi:hypothetical protein